MDIWRSVGRRGRAPDQPPLARDIPRISRRAHAALHGSAPGRLGIGALRHGRRPADSPRRELRSRGVRLGRGERRRPASRRDRRESDIASLDGADLGARRGRLAVISRFSLPAVRAAAPRFGPGYLLFLSSKGGADGLWKFKDGSDTELWKGARAPSPPRQRSRPTAPRSASWSRDGKQARLHTMAADGTGARRITESLDVRDAPSWSPDGRWIAVVASEGKEQPLFKIAVDGGAPVRLVGGNNYDPVWSPDGRFIAYSRTSRGAEVPAEGVTPEKQPFRLPEVHGRGRRQSLSVSTGRQGAGADPGVITGIRTSGCWTSRPGSCGSSRTYVRASTRRASMSPRDGKQILFDRFRENSDVVLIDLPPR